MGKSITQEQYLIEEAREAELVREFEEWDCDETVFADEGEITLEDLKTSPIYKATYNKWISASNWIRWILG
jgi:hypothetical protein